jgi:RNA recognition motif-containing protein
MTSITDSPEVTARTIFVRNLPFESTIDDLIECFTEYGEVEEVRLCYEPYRQGDALRSRGFGFFNSNPPAPLVLLSIPRDLRSFPVVN